MANDEAKKKEAPELYKRHCLRKADLERLLGVKRTTRQRLTRLPDFPKSFKLGGTTEVWDSEEVYAWLDTQKQEHGN